MGFGLNIAERFAKALDAEDYVAAESLLDAGCEYTCRGAFYRGPSEIIASYQSNGDAAKRFDSVEYTSEVVPLETGKFVIRFADHLSHRGRNFVFRCEQLIDVNECGKIVRISHRDLPGQVESLSEFKDLL